MWSLRHCTHCVHLLFLLIAPIRGTLSRPATARIKNLHAQFSEKEASLELAKEKAESNLHFVQQKALELHKTLLVSLKAVHKHRFKWISKLVVCSLQFCATCVQQLWDMGCGRAALQG